MAKLKNLVLREKSASGERVEYSIPLTVGVSGIFRAVAPPELHEVIIQRKGASAGHEFDGKGQMIVFSNRLNEVEGVLRQAVRDSLQCEIKRERVIVYSYRNRLCFYRGIDGGLYPNASYDTQGTGMGSVGARWNESIRAHSSPDDDEESGSVTHYSVGVFARVYEKVSYIRPSGTRVEYNRSEPPNEGEYHRKLNAFLKFKDMENREDFSEMPYTEEAARFFYETLLGLCRVGDRLEAFFSNPAKVALAIEVQDAVGWNLARL